MSPMEFEVEGVEVALGYFQFHIFIWAPKLLCFSDYIYVEDIKTGGIQDVETSRSGTGNLIAPIPPILYNLLNQSSLHIFFREV